VFAGWKELRHALIHTSISPGIQPRLGNSDNPAEFQSTKGIVARWAITVILWCFTLRV